MVARHKSNNGSDITAMSIISLNVFGGASNTDLAFSRLAFALTSPELNFNTIDEFVTLSVQDGDSIAIANDDGTFSFDLSAARVLNITDEAISPGSAPATFTSSATVTCTFDPAISQGPSSDVPEASTILGSVLGVGLLLVGAKQKTIRDSLALWLGAR